MLKLLQNEFVKIFKKKSIFVKNEELFFKIVKSSFKQKRKTLKNNLREYDLKKIEKLLEKIKLMI